jgi:hypothetical protein
MPGGAGQGSFYVQMMGSEQGPVSFNDLAYQAKAGTLRATTMVRRAEGGNWFPAGDVPWLFSDKDWLTTLLISFFLGGLGIDRMYLGYTGLGILKLITCGGCGLWALYDLIMIVIGRLPDSNGRPLRRT